MQNLTVIFARCYCRTLVASRFAAFFFLSFFFPLLLFFFKTESTGTVYCFSFSAIHPDSPSAVAVTQNNSSKITEVSVT